MLLKMNVYKATLNFFYFQVNFDGFEKNGIKICIFAGYVNYRSEFKRIFTIKKGKGEEM